MATDSVNKNAQIFHLSEHLKTYIADSVNQAFISYLNNYHNNANSSYICQIYSDCLSICKSINTNSNAVDLVDESGEFDFLLTYLYLYEDKICTACPLTVLDFLCQKVMDNINENRFPELTYLIQDGEDVNSFSLISPEDILLRWINYHLRKAGSCRIAKNFTTDLAVRILNICIAMNTLFN
jgi:hypothetical protein